MIVDTIFAEIASKVFNDIVDISKDRIINAVKNKNSKHQNLESQLYSIIVDVLNEIFLNPLEKNQDKIFDVAEALLIGFKDNKKNDTETIRLCLEDYKLYNNNNHIKFKKLLYHKLAKEEYKELNNEIDLVWKEQESKKTSRIEQEINRISQKLDDVKSNNKSEMINQDFDEKSQNNKKQEYIDNWNSRLFLHQDNDENPLTLANTFIIPDFRYYSKVQEMRCSIPKILEETKSSEDTLEEVIEKFFAHNGTLNMLIKGVPGIGKTSITSWIANKYKKDDRVIILRFRDWEKEELESGLLKAIYNTLKCKKENLNDKILILDGIDEIKSLNLIELLLHRFFNEILDIRNIKIIITSRLNYLDSICFENELEILPFDNKKIKIFYHKITGIELDEGKIKYDNSDVLGIPVILYMAIMSNIDITEETTKPELYNRIFSEKGGIFDRFSYKGIAYDEGSHILRDKENIKKYLKFLREISFMMFEKNNLFLLKKEYKIPKLEFQGDSVNILEFPIKHLFENTEFNIEFIHKTIYEYFVAEYIFTEIDKAINKNILEEFAKVLGGLFKANNLSEEILDFLRYKIKKSNLNKKFDILKNTFQLMLQNGMTYYTNECYKNVIKCEMNIFSNMLETIHLWGNFILKLDDSISIYLHCNINIKLNLVRTNLSKINLRVAHLGGADLTDADLTRADLTDASLIYTDLTRVNLSSANLTRANLARAYLISANLTGANLTGANLTRADLTHANLTGANLGGANLTRADLTGTDLTGADLTGANLAHADLTGTDLIDANLTRADLTGTDLTDAYL